MLLHDIPFLSILNALQEHREKRKKEVRHGNIEENQIESYEKQAWKEFWMAESEGLLLYSCLYGTVDAVKYFVAKFVSPTVR